MNYDDLTDPQYRFVFECNWGPESYHDYLMRSDTPHAPYECMYCGQLVGELIDDPRDPLHGSVCPAWVPLILEEDEPW